MTTRLQSGVTLIELLVTLSIAVILMAIAVPGFQDFFRRNRLDSSVSEFVASLNLARSEAIRRGVRVSLCRSSTGTNCTADQPWQAGWIVFSNPDDDNVVDAGEEIVRRHQALPAGVTLNATDNFTNRITYRPDGRITNNVGGSFFFCHGGTEDARRILVIGTGRARVEGATTCS